MENSENDTLHGNPSGCTWQSNSHSRLSRIMVWFDGSSRVHFPRRPGLVGKRTYTLQSAHAASCHDAVFGGAGAGRLCGRSVKVDKLPADDHISRRVPSG